MYISKIRNAVEILVKGHHQKNITVKTNDKRTKETKTSSNFVFIGQFFVVVFLLNAKCAYHMEYIV